MRFCAFSGGLVGISIQNRLGSSQSVTDADLFTLGMLPVAVGMLWQMRGSWIATVAASLTVFERHCYRVGTLGYYSALRAQNASVVTPVTGLFPVLTVVLAFVVLRERLNKVQMGGVLLALASSWSFRLRNS